MTGTGGIQVGQGPCDHLCQRRAAAAGVPQWRRHDGQLSRAGRARRAAAHRYTDATSQSVFGVMGPQNCTPVHQAAQIPGSGVFLPSFLPREATQRSRDVVSPGHSSQIEGVGRNGPAASQADSAGSIPVTRSNGLPTELPVSCRQNCTGDRFLIVLAWSDIGSGRCARPVYRMPTAGSRCSGGLGGGCCPAGVMLVSGGDGVLRAVSRLVGSRAGWSGVGVPAGRCGSCRC